MQEQAAEFKELRTFTADWTSRLGGQTRHPMHSCASSVSSPSSRPSSVPCSAGSAGSRLATRCDEVHMLSSSQSSSGPHSPAVFMVPTAATRVGGVVGEGNLGDAPQYTTLRLSTLLDAPQYTKLRDAPQYTTLSYDAPQYTTLVDASTTAASPLDVAKAMRLWGTGDLVGVTTEGHAPSQTSSRLLGVGVDESRSRCVGGERPGRQVDATSESERPAHTLLLQHHQKQRQMVEVMGGKLLMEDCTWDDDLEEGLGVLLASSDIMLKHCRVAHGRVASSSSSSSSGGSIGGSSTTSAAIGAGDGGLSIRVCGVGNVHVIRS